MYVNPVSRKFTPERNISTMPFGGTVHFNVSGYEDEKVQYIATKWLPPHASVNRYENANKGYYKSNQWIEIPPSGKFFIYEHNVNNDFFRVFDTHGYDGEEPLWECSWDKGRLLIEST